MQAGHTDTETLTYNVILDAAYDLGEGRRCTCEACCDAFAAAFEGAADELAAELSEAEGRPVEIGVYRATYGSAESHDVGHDPLDYWTRIHGRITWDDSDADAVHGYTVAERDAVIEVIDAARGTWTGADWTHERTDDEGRDVQTAKGEPVYCEGGELEKCQRCRDAQSAADGAESHADDAADLLRAGDVEGAIRYLEAAVSLEQDYGDAPTWGPVLALAKKLQS